MKKIQDNYDENIDKEVEKYKSKHLSDTRRARSCKR